MPINPRPIDPWKPAMKKNEDPVIVQFESGKYAVRKITHNNAKFADLKTPGHWWTKDSQYMKDCLADSEKGVKEALKNVNIKIHELNVQARDKRDMGKPVDKPDKSIEAPANRTEPMPPATRSVKGKPFKMPKFGKWFTD